MIEIREDWHPIFRFLYNIFHGQRGIKYYRNLQRNLLVQIASFLNKEDPWIGLVVRRDPFRGGKKPIVEEQFHLYYRDGSSTIENYEGENSSLDNLLELLENSALINPYTGEFISPEEAAREDEYFENIITAIDTWGHRVRKKLERQNTGIIEAPPLFGPESEERDQSS